MNFLEAIELEKIELVLVCAVISLLVSYVTSVLYWKRRLEINHKFEQRKKLKQEIAKNKVQLLNAVESMNHRLWGFNQNIHKYSEEMQKSDLYRKKGLYYLSSFIYRFLCVMFWIVKTEKEALSIDSTIADREDVTYLKWVKALKYLFMDRDLVDREIKGFHFFYKNKLESYAKLVSDSDGGVLDYDSFRHKFTNNHEQFCELIEYFKNIEETPKETIFCCFHLLSMNFLNAYGHDYQKTNYDKLHKIVSLYSKKINEKNAFYEFVKKSKLNRQMSYVISMLHQDWYFFLNKKINFLTFLYNIPFLGTLIKVIFCVPKGS